MATWWSPFVDDPTSFVIPADPKGYIQLMTHFATLALGEAVPSNRRFNPRISAPLRRVLLLCRYVLFSA
jgi:hypothetical protein